MKGDSKNESVSRMAKIPKGESIRQPAEKTKTQDFSVSFEKGKRSKMDDAGLKYVQILFYYVQDASLFKILLPQDEQNESILTDILLFSPPSSLLYANISNFCLSQSSAVTKIFIRSLFGPFVIILLFFIFLFHKFILFVKKYSNSQKMFSDALLQAFLLSILLSFQQIIKGSLILIQCVAVHEDNILLIQGNIKCYT